MSNYSVDLDKTMRVKQSAQEGKLEVSEHSLYEEIDKLLEDDFSHVHRLQLSSCLPAMIQLLRDGMKGFDVWQNGDDVESDLSILDKGNQDDFTRVEGSLPAAARNRCAEAVDKFGLLRVDTKLGRLRTVLESLKRPRADGIPHKAIVFTQWMPTWSYLDAPALEPPGFEPSPCPGLTTDGPSRRRCKRPRVGGQRRAYLY